MAAKRPKAPAGCFWKGNVLYGRSRVAGRLIRWSLETDDPKIAARRRKEGKDRLIAVKRGDAVRSLQDVIEQWSADWLVPNKGPQTAKRYLCSIGQLAPFLEGRTLDQIDGKLIAEIIRIRRDRDGITNATIKRDLVALSSVFNYAIDQGWLEANPVLPRMKRVEEKRDPIVLPSQADIDLVLSRAQGMMADMIRAAIATGAREEELFRAEPSQVDHGRRQMLLVGKGRKGVKRRRVIDLEPFGGYELIRALPPSPRDRTLFWHSDGRQYRGFATQFWKLVKRTEAWASRNGVPFRRFRFHDLRHLHAVNWLKDGRSIYDLQRRLGHASIKTTEDYCKFLTPDEDRIVKGLAVSQIVSPAMRTGVA